MEINSRINQVLRNHVFLYFIVFLTLVFIKYLLFSFNIFHIEIQRGNNKGTNWNGYSIFYIKKVIFQHDFTPQQTNRTILKYYITHRKYIGNIRLIFYFNRCVNSLTSDSPRYNYRLHPAARLIVRFKVLRSMDSPHNYCCSRSTLTQGGRTS